jgi:ATPase subunit of ABC transporter with duplicated ATPase domains
LNITVTSAGGATATGERPTAKGKGKAKSDGIEILANAKLRLKEGQRYALVGRNGTGKSTLLKAIAEKLIPGIPENTRIAILQQTRLDGQDGNPEPKGKSSTGSTVLQEVVERATAKLAVEKEINGM